MPSADALLNVMLDAVARTHAGRVRDVNEDGSLILSPLFAVADGMGGHASGEVASRVALERLAELFAAGEIQPGRSLLAALTEANNAVLGAAARETSARGMGTTCTAILIEDRRAHVAHIGDSRAYLYRAGYLRQLTQDHTLVGDMVRHGHLTAGEARAHRTGNAITRALGLDTEVFPDVLEETLQSGDRLLLCSDGLWAQVDDAAIADALAKPRSPAAAAETLIRLANEVGGKDNVTALIVDVDFPPQNQPSDPQATNRVEEPSPPSHSPSLRSRLHSFLGRRIARADRRNDSL